MDCGCMTKYTTHSTYSQANSWANLGFSELPEWQELPKQHDVSLSSSLILHVLHCSSRHSILSVIQTVKTHLPLQISLVTFAFMAAQWPVYLAGHSSSEACSQRSWPEGPQSLWDWLVTWNSCRTFSTNYLILWGGRWALAWHMCHSLRAS